MPVPSPLSSLICHFMLRTLSSALVAFIQRDKFWFVSFLLSLCSSPLPHSLFLPDFLCLSCSLKGILNFVLSRTFHLLRTTFATGHLTPTHRAHMFLSLFLCLSCSSHVCVCMSAWLTLLYSAELALSLCVGRMCATHLEIS